MTKTKLSFIAEAQGADGKVQLYHVYSTGDSFYVTGPTGYRHNCHPNVRTWEHVTHEIERTFEVTVTATKQPWEYNNPRT